MSPRHIKIWCELKSASLAYNEHLEHIVKQLKLLSGCLGFYYREHSQDKTITSTKYSQHKYKL